ncbi:MAG: hypothetical protein J6A47_08185 [Bacilli bacterium]|nr:hypothetical protein [Bacilli bacterium]
MAKLLELRRLSKEFYKAYPHSKYPEMEAKENRPYVVLLVEINKIQFAIPLRTNIRHSYCYKFKTSDRKTDSITGVDYSKAVVISKVSYLGEATDINDKEYLELQQKTFFIINKFKKYVDDYISYKKYGGNEFVAKRYSFSTLKYFDDILLNSKD